MKIIKTQQLLVAIRMLQGASPDACGDLVSKLDAVQIKLNNLDAQSFELRAAIYIELRKDWDKEDLAKVQEILHL